MSRDWVSSFLDHCYKAVWHRRLFWAPSRVVETYRLWNKPNLNINPSFSLLLLLCVCFYLGFVQGVFTLDFILIFCKSEKKLFTSEGWCDRWGDTYKTTRKRFDINYISNKDLFPLMSDFLLWQMVKYCSEILVCLDTESKKIFLRRT